MLKSFTNNLNRFNTLYSLKNNFPNFGYTITRSNTNNIFLFNTSKFSFSNEEVPKEFIEVMKQRNEQLEEYDIKFGSVMRIGESKMGNKAQFYAKKLRRAYINHGVYPQQKHIIPIKAIRKRTDSLQGIRKDGNVAAVIWGREEHPDFDFIIEQKYVKNLNKRPNWQNKPVYLKWGFEEIRCNIAKYENHYRLGHPIKVEFNRYIVGRPNLLNFKLEPVAIDKNSYINELDCEWVQYIQDIQAWCFEEEYPPTIEVDLRWVDPKKPFKLMDLEKTLPDGMFLHRKYDKILDHSIISMGESWNQVITSTKYLLDDAEERDENEKSKEVQDLADMGKEILKDIEEKKKAKRPKLVPFSQASAKKILASRAILTDKKAMRQLMTHGGAGDDGKKKK